MRLVLRIYLQKELVYPVAQPGGLCQEILALGNQEVEHGCLVFFDDGG